MRVVNRDAFGTTVYPVDYIVHVRSQRLYVLPVEGGNEGGTQFVEDTMRQAVTLPLQVFDALVVGIAFVGLVVVHALYQHGRRGNQHLGQLLQQGEKLGFFGGESAKKGIFHRLIVR